MLDGQATIDRMKNEIETIVSLLVGIAAKYLGSDLQHVDHEFEADHCVWRIWATHPQSDVPLGVRCSRLVALVRGEALYGNLNKHRVLLKDVLLVHQNLGTFVHGVLEQFPAIEESEEWKALMDAGEPFDQTAADNMLDQITKYIVLGRFQPGESLPVTSFFNLVLASIGAVQTFEELPRRALALRVAREVRLFHAEVGLLQETEEPRLCVGAPVDVVLARHRPPSGSTRTPSDGPSS